MAQESIWTRNEFPTQEVNLSSFNHWPGKGRCLTGTSDHWNAKKRKPFCWTPVKPFWFGGKEFAALYPCIAFETTNFGHVVQRTWEGIRVGRE